MPTNSTFGWPIVSKSDMFKPSTQSSLEGAAFDNRVSIERQRHEKNVATVSALPASGDYLGQAVWVTARNRPYYWDGAAWKSGAGFEAGTIVLNSLSFPGNGGVFKWTAPLTIALPAGRFSAQPYVFVNAGDTATYANWGSVVGRTTTNFTVRIYSTSPTPTSIGVQWVAFDSN